MTQQPWLVAGGNVSGATTAISSGRGPRPKGRDQPSIIFIFRQIGPFTWVMGED